MNAAYPFELYLFGTFRVLLYGKPLPPLRTRKGLALLALLTLRGGIPIERDWLAGTLWPDSEQGQALYNLRQILSDLRRALGDQAGRLLSPTPRTLALDLCGAFCDVLLFDAAADQEEAEAWEKAIDMVAGPLLLNWSDDWILQERTRRQETLLHLLEQLAQQAAERGEWEKSVSFLRRLIGEDRGRERAQQRLLEALATLGDYAAMTEAYRNFRLYMHEELNSAPSAETVALYQRLRDQARQTTAAGTTARTQKALPLVTGNVPHPVSRLIGREREIAEIIALFPSARLVTLTGAGGVGKTRLAMAVATQVADSCPHGAWWVELAPLTESQQVPAAIAAALELREIPGEPLWKTITEFLRERHLLLVIDNCEHLLSACADVCGRLLRECGEMKILATSRERLGIFGEMAWSAPSLPVPPVNGLPDGVQQRTEAIGQSAAVQLFVERARAARSAFRLSEENDLTVAALCRDLDGIPLAIELAAARMGTLSVEEISRRLSNRFALLTEGDRLALPRQQTLRALIDWSYQLLSEPERLLMARLSVFRGGWTLETAETVVTEAGDRFASSLLESMNGLAARSLVVIEESEEGTRYRMLETVAAYARERLDECEGETEKWNRQHALSFLEMAERADADYLGTAEAGWLKRQERENENLRKALRWFLDSEAIDPVRPANGLKMANCLDHFWRLRGHLTEGAEFLTLALSRVDTAQPEPEIARAYANLGSLSENLGAIEQGEFYFARAYEMYQQIGDLWGQGRTLHSFGAFYANRAQYPEAQEKLKAALVLCRKAGDIVCESECLGNLGYIARVQGDLSSARDLLEQAIAAAQRAGDRMMETAHSGSLGYVFEALREYPQALVLFERAGELYRQAGNRLGEAWSLNSLGFVARQQGDFVRARQWLEKAAPIYEEAGHSRGMAWTLDQLGVALHGTGELDRAQECLEKALELTQESKALSDMVSVLMHLAKLHCQQRNIYQAGQRLAQVLTEARTLGLKQSQIQAIDCAAELCAVTERMTEALRFLASAEAIRTEVGIYRAPTEEREITYLLAHLSALVPKAEVEGIQEEGRRLSLEATLEAILELCHAHSLAPHLKKPIRERPY